MGQMIHNIQYRIKTSSAGTGVLVLRLIIGYIVGLTVALATQQMIGFGDFSFYLMIVVIMSGVLKASKGWGFGGVMIFSLVCVLIGLLLRLYIEVAPGA